MKIKKEAVKGTIGILGIWGIYAVAEWFLYKVYQNEMECRRAADELNNLREEEERLRQTAAIFNLNNLNNLNN